VSTHSAKYFLREGFKNVWVNGVMSAASVLVMVCCMILTGGAILLSMNLNKALKSVENQNSLTVFLKKDVSSGDAMTVGKEIEKIPNILKCEYYSSQQAAEKYKDVLGDLYEVVQEGENPFPEAFHVTMKDLSLYGQTVSALKSIGKVESVSDRSETAKKLSDLNKLIASAGVWVVCSLGVVSLFIISNTIKITMHNRRFEINIMKSVGATNSFIKIPFIVEGIIIGCIAAVLSTLILKLVYDSLLGVVGGIIPFQGIYFKNIFWQVLLCFLPTGIFFGVAGGLISIRRYLKKEGGDVVAW
jgi:cell division transport system permease protein